MSSIIGNRYKVSIFGESHGKCIGVVIDGMPPGFEIDMEELKRFLGRRSPGSSDFTTLRKERDLPKFMSGLLDNTTTGFPLCAIIENEDKRSKDYDNLENLPRPSHGDYTAFLKYKGFADLRGSGHLSGRLTAPLCIAGGIAKQILNKKGIYIGAHLYGVGDIRDKGYDFVNVDKNILESTNNSSFPTISEDKGNLMKELIGKVKNDSDSIGSIIEIGVVGMPKAIGKPIFNTVEGRLSQMAFSIPAVKGVEFGKGFEASTMRGSEHNDNYMVVEGEVRTRSNNSSGIVSGITNGMPIVYRTIFKPTASIGKSQTSVNLETMEEEELLIEGRHDPCIGVRAVAVMEAATSVVLLDMLMEEGYYD
ncbi:chorismate synthase [Lagierella sp.]|uniref:chorismate synthase n=1 Tax=Lagierella sp. TaxID=2849657 RepID=UPI0026044404|nr:chorismate synthase [Lagierella sp.]